MLQRKALKMSWLNHLFLVYILFYFPWPYLCNIFLIIWNDIVMYPLPTLSSVWGAGWDLQTFLVLWIHVSGGPETLLYWKMAVCGFLFLFYSKLLDGAETGSGLWGWPPLAYVESLETSHSSRAMWPSRGDMDMRAETSGSHPMEYGLWMPS